MTSRTRAWGVDPLPPSAVGVRAPPAGRRYVARLVRSGHGARAVLVRRLTARPSRPRTPRSRRRTGRYSDPRQGDDLQPRAADRQRSERDGADHRDRRGRQRRDGVQARHARPRRLAAALERRALAGRDRHRVVGVQRPVRRGQGARRQRPRRRRLGLARARRTRGSSWPGRSRSGPTGSCSTTGRRGTTPTAGRCSFSDGSTVAVSDLPADGDAKVVTFPARTFDRVRFQVEGGSGPNVGLLEFEVFAVPRAPGPPERVTVAGERVPGSRRCSTAAHPCARLRRARLTGGELVAERTVEGLETTMPAAEEYRVAATNIVGTGPSRASRSAPRGSTSSARTRCRRTTRYSGRIHARRHDLPGRDLDGHRPAGRADLHRRHRRRAAEGRTPAAARCWSPPSTRTACAGASS